MAHVMYIINNLVQIAVIIFFTNNFLKPKYSYILLETLIAISFSAVYLTGALYFRWELSNVLFNILRNIPNFLGVLIGYEGSLLKKVKTYLLIFCFLAAGSFLGTPLMLCIFGKDYGEVQYASFQQNFGMMAWSDIALIIAILVSVLKNREDDFFRKNQRSIFTMIAFPMVHLGFMCLYMAYHADHLDVLTVFIHLVYQAMMITLIIIQFYASKRSHALLKTEESLNRMQSEIQHTYNYCMLADQKFHDISKLRHDINNQIQAIKQLIAVERNTVEAEKMIEELQEKLSKMRNVQFCSNPVINAVLTPKAYAANDEGISSDILLSDCDSLPFDNYDLCSLFANLYDNAVEACRRIHGDAARFIEVKSRNKGNYFVIKVINSCEETIHLQGTLLETSKQGKGHGYGIQIIQSIVDKYQGDLKIESKDNTFCVTVAMLREKVKA